MTTLSKPATAYHPQQMLVGGYSGAGKTTLIAALIRRFCAAGLAVGFAKHDGHSFQMDREGKDTALAYEAGARLVTINDAAHRATISRTPSELPVTEGCDVLLVEGHKRARGPKVLVVRPGDEQSFTAEIWQDAAVVVGPELAPSAGLAAELKARGLPYRHRDDIAAIAADIIARLTPATEPVGLVLAGGKSRRMGRDKGLIDYHGEPQAQHLARLLSRHCSQVALSTNADNAGHYQDAGFTLLTDRLVDFGPLGALATAMAAFPGQPLLVTACDLPFIDAKALAALLAGRRPLKAATCYGSADRGLPEPMFAIYEPRLQPTIWRRLGEMAAGTSKGCARKLLLEASLALLPPAKEVNLANANHPEDFAKAHRAIKEMR